MVLYIIMVSSYLFVLVNCFECYVKVLESGVDVVIVDLEDVFVLL